MKRNDVVFFHQGGRTYNALVLAEAPANDTRRGAKKEPSLHLVVVFDDPPKKHIPLGALPEPTIVHDVVHASHKFDADYFKQYGADAKSHRGNGEWTEAELKDSPATTAYLNRNKKPLTPAYQVPPVESGYGRGRALTKEEQLGQKMGGSDRHLPYQANAEVSGFSAPVTSVVPKFVSETDQERWQRSAETADPNYQQTDQARTDLSRYRGAVTETAPGMVTQNPVAVPPAPAGPAGLTTREALENYQSTHEPKE